MHPGVNQAGRSASRFGTDCRKLAISPQPSTAWGNAVVGRYLPGPFRVPLAGAERATPLGWAVVVVPNVDGGRGQLELWALDVAARARRRRRRNSIGVWARCVPRLRYLKRYRRSITIASKPSSQRMSKLLRWW